MTMPNSVDQPVQGGTSLELTIDFMSESSGGCFDQRHYHSFQGVSFLLPLRSCAGCGQRLKSVAFGGSSTNQAVQCIACGVFAHRSCGFSKDTDWKNENYCSVNYTTVMKDKDNELENTLSQIQENESEINEQNIESSKNESNEKRSLVLFPFDSLIRPTATEMDKNTEAHSQNSDEITFESETNKSSVFREPAELFVDNPLDGKSDLSTPFNNTQHRLLKASSEDGILDGSKNGKYSKANFPFLSASKLLQSCREENVTTEGSATGSSEVGSGSTGDNFFIRTTKSWSTAEVCAQNDEEEGHKVVFSYIQAEETPEGQNVPLEAGTENDDEESKTNNPLEWTESGPPAHWATHQSLENMIPKIKADEAETDDATKDGPLHFASHPFSSVSRALQENIIAHFRPVVDRILSKEESGNLNEINRVESNNEVVVEEASQEPENQSQEISRTNSADSESPSDADVEGLLEEYKPKVDTSTSQKRLGLATVAGGIAGGVAGFMVAGPVGLVIGTKAFQAAGILGLILDGSVTIGVMAGGVAAGMNTGQQLQQKLEQSRVLSLGEDGTHRRVLLVRPSVTIDPEWAAIYKEVRQSHSKGLPFSILPSESKAVKRERYEREVDIVKTDEAEIPTVDKVLLLVSRILNNRESLPGHVYRHLIEKLRQRSEERGTLLDLYKSQSLNGKDNNGEEKVGPDLTFKPTDARRARRQDAHAVIKYVTATLLEVRPGFAVSPAITELTATAVEGLVFGEVYSLVMEEIEMEYSTQDNGMLEKIAEFDRCQACSDDGVKEYKSCISEPALESLYQLPDTHSAVDKLRQIVLFLERISDFFAASDTKGSMGADSLLKMVCQHILVAKVFGINAQIAFLEEFARDEQLLRGKEGYSLVTLQASLHFLNASKDFEDEIFRQQDDY